METLPEDERPRAAARMRGPRPHLFLVMEAQRPRATGARHDLGDVDEVLFGRGDHREARRSDEDGRRRLHLTVPDPWASSAHARLRRTPSGWIAEDLGSRNGLYVDGARVAQAVAVADGSVVEVGHSFFQLVAALSTSADAPADLDGAALAAVSPGLRTLVPALELQLAALRRIAASPLTVLIGGETGTGKEVIARAVHEASGRAGAFVAVNCGALPATLVESELFGARRGAYSGATHDRPGLVRAADRGTLFLDEIGDLPLPAQVALLRVLQEREVLPIGGTQAHKVDLRVVAATHQDVAALVAQGRFRADLYARLAGFVLTLPPLRERRQDLGLLVGELLGRAGAPAATFTLAAARALLAHDWPLNVRELEQRLQAAVALAGADAEIDREHLGALTTPRPAPPLDDEHQARRQRLVSLLEEHAGNVSAVAAAMGLSRMQVHRWLRRYQLDAQAFRG
jgi:DNA-binding NtrC family response regulator